MLKQLNSLNETNMRYWISLFFGGGYWKEKIAQGVGHTKKMT
jgi:hypothetical protein